jgi:hypothetical protein
MKSRALTAQRVLEVQKSLHRLEEIKFVQVQQRLAANEREQLELTRALSEDGALHSLFIDMTARRLIALRQEANRLSREMEERARALIDHAGRLRTAERLTEALDLDLRRAGERTELEEILDLSVARSDASLKQDD